MKAILLAALSWASGRAAETCDWPMLAHDPGRSGVTAVEIRPPFARKWYRLFPDEGLMAGVQPVVAQGRVFVGTQRGILHAIDDGTGEDVWSYAAGGPILHTCAADEGNVFFGAADGKIYAIETRSGKLAWSVQTGAAVWNAPLVHEGLVLAGSRDGKLYAVDARSGTVRWAAATDAPLLSSPALDAKASRAFIGSEDMRVSAFDLRDGRKIWVSDPLPGVTMRGYHPVVAPDGSVMVTVAPAAPLDTMAQVLLDMVKQVFGDFASWRHNKQENAQLRQANFQLMEDPETYERQLDYLRRRLADQPAYQTFFVLDGATGRQRFVTPIVYSESMNGTGAPALVLANGKVIVKYQVLLRSRYEHYSPFLNIGYLDTANGRITPIMDQTRTYGWHDSLLLVHDEQCQLSAAGRVLINTHQDNVNGMDLDTLQGYSEPFCRNIHEPQPGEAVGIQLRLLRGQTIPAGKEWLARGTAVYGGGSVIDVPVSIAGDSLYYLPTHEINSGAAVIAYRMQAGGDASKQQPPPSVSPTDEDWQKIQRLRWDWDTLGMPRLDHVLKALPGTVAGTRQQPLREEAAAAAARIADAEIDRFIWEAPSLQRPAAGIPADVAEKLSHGVREVISHPWRPWVFPAGKHPIEAYRYFTEPAETLFTLARAYRFLDAGLQLEVKQHVANMAAAGGPLDSPTGQRLGKVDAGEVRTRYAVPDRLLRVVDDIQRTGIAQLYPFWLWAHVTSDWSKVEKDWAGLRLLLDSAPTRIEEDCRNGYVAGLIAYCRVAQRVGDEEALRRGVAKTRGAIRERLAFEFAHPRGGLISQVPVGRSIFSRWRHLTPEVGRLLATHAGPVHRELMAVQVDFHRPTWWLAWNVELMVRNESPFSLPTMSAEIFSARAMVLQEPGEKLAAYLDLPWCRADLFFLQKLASCAEAHTHVTWRDVRDAR